VRRILADEHADVLRESLAWFVRELMEVEVATKIGADLHERSAERTKHRKGFRESLWQTHAGEIEPAVVPVIDGTRTIGIVPLPEAMTDMILVGGEDSQAMRLQMVIVFMLPAAALVSGPADCAAFAPHAERAG
jgi:hypothetical protein